MVFLKSKPVFCIQKDIQLSTIAQVKDQMVKKLKGILKNQQTALGQDNVTLTLFFLLFHFDGKSLPTVGYIDKRVISKTTNLTIPKLFPGLIQAIWRKNEQIWLKKPPEPFKELFFLPILGLKIVFFYATPLKPTFLASDRLDSMGSYLPHILR